MLTYFCYHGLLLLIVFLLLRSVWQSSYTSFRHFRVLSWLGGFSAVMFALLFSEFIGGRVSFNLAIHGLAWYGSFFLFASAFLMYRQKKNNEKLRRGLPTFVLLFGFIYFGVAANTLLFEPIALVVREKTIITPKITKPITIVFCSDIQSNSVGWYERWTLRKVKEQNADLIIFGGDYISGGTDAERAQSMKDWNHFFREINLQAPLGIYAVRGTDVHDWARWKEKFVDTGIIPHEYTLTEQIGEIRVTFLSIDDSETNRTIPDEEREGQFRIIVGHSPRFALAEQDANLLLAGHTHGGQVQIPFWGPIIHLSGRDFPRRWATGTTAMPNGATLIVTHGAGLVRGKSAPRVRFWCRPDFWVIRLVPEVESRQ